MVAFLDIYPKRGPLQQLDIEDSEVRRLMQEFLAEMSEGSVVQHDIDNLLAEVQETSDK